MRNRMHVLAALLIVSLFLLGCTSLDENEDLPVNRRVRIVTFPVRPLEFHDETCIQEYDRFTLSGSLKNVSYTPVSSVEVLARLSFPDDPITVEYVLHIDPPVLQPGESGSFTLADEVEYPISNIELHVRWEPFVPPGL
ncbi:MAG: hypothetical protein Kow0099_14590 [Candidatus Abyssubacteria bacterium]